MTRLRAVAVSRFLRGERVVGKPAVARLGGSSLPRLESNSRRRGARVRIAVGAIALFLLSCASSLNFREYRACHEELSKNLHDPGTVVWEDLGEDGKRHYGFLPDRLADDRRQIVDVTGRVNRACVLVAGVGSQFSQPPNVQEDRQ
jgi:hypothetical protein